MFFPFKWVLSMTSAYCLQIYVSICSPIYMYIILHPPSDTWQAIFRFSVCYCCHVLCAPLPADPFDFSFFSFFFRGVLFSVFGFLFFWGIHGACIILACRSCQRCSPLQLLLAFKWICKRRISQIVFAKTKQINNGSGHDWPRGAKVITVARFQ